MANLGYYLQAPAVMQLQNGDYLASQNGDYTAAVQVDGNLCVYLMPSKQPVWCATGQSQCLAVYYASMQSDTNLCVYSGIGDPVWLANPKAVWCSGTYQPPPVQCFLVLENDGELNVYLGTPSQPGHLLWSSDPDRLAAAQAKHQGE